MDSFSGSDLEKQQLLEMWFTGLIYQILPFLYTEEDS